MYLDRTGCAWRYLPSDFPPWQTVYTYFAAWRDDGTLARLHAQLRARVRTAAGRAAGPTAAVIDSQSVRAADTVPRASRGWDAAKKVNGRKRHIAVDTMGLVLDVVITAASVQDRVAARPLLWNTHRACRRVRLVWADAGYTGKLAAWAATLKMTLQIVAKRDAHAFEVLPRRWVVERTFAWISKHRRTVRDYEHLPASHEAMILWAMTALMARRLAQTTDLSDAHLDQGGSAGLRRGPAPAPGSALGGPPGARRASTRSRTPDQSAHSQRHQDAPPHSPAPLRSLRDRPCLDGPGSLIRFRSCSPPGQAGQGRSLRSRRRGDGASATLDSPAPPGGFRQLSDEAPPRLGQQPGGRTWRRPASPARSPGPTNPHASPTHGSLSRIPREPRPRMSPPRCRRARRHRWRPR